MSSLSRLRALQNICATSGVDGLLFVGGVDGKHHAGSRETLAWLLTGLNGRDIFGYNRLDSQLDEAVLLVMPDAVRLYAPPDLWKRLQPLLGNWRRLQVYTPPAAIIDDYEAVEEHKIRSFISIVRGVRLIGVPLPASESAKGPGAAVEAWPLIQSFALQDFEKLTGGGFFTQVHKVSCVGEETRAVLLQLDPPSLEWLGANEAPRLAACLHECVGTVDASTDGGRPLRASEAELFEPALVYHSHGQLRANNMPNASALPGSTSSIAPHGVKRLGAYIGRRSALLCGASGGLKALPSAGPPGEATAAATARSGDPDGPEAQPRHLCAELTEPFGPLYAGRSYFLGSGARAPPRGASEEVEELLGSDEAAGPIKKAKGARAAIAAAAAAADVSGVEDGRMSDSDVLQGIYGALVYSVDATLQSASLLCAENAVPELSKSIATQLAMRLSHSEVLPRLHGDAAPLLERLTVEVCFVDLLGNSYRGPDASSLALNGKLLVNTRFVLALDGLPLETPPSTPLGALLLGDTYACTPSGGLVGLSHGISRYEVWRAPGSESDASSDLSSACETATRITFGHEFNHPSAGSLKPKMPTHALVGGLLGEPLADVLDGCCLLPGSSTLQPTQCDAYVFSRGAVLMHPRAGAMLLLFDAGLSPRRVDVYEHDGASATITEGSKNDALLEALRGKKPSAANNAAERAMAVRGALTSEDGLPVDGALLLRLWYTLEQLQSIFGARAGFFAAGALDAPLEEDHATGQSGSGRGTLVDLTLAICRPASRRTLRREVLPAWREQWAKRGTECMPEIDVQMPPALACMPTETMLGTWPTTALKNAVKAAPASTPSAASPPPPAESTVRVLLITGPPGAAIGEAAAGTIALTSGSSRWLTSVYGTEWCDGKGGCDVEKLTSLLTAFTACSLHKKLTGADALLPERLLITTHGFVDLPSTVAAVVAACASASQSVDCKNLVLSAVVTCVDAPRALEKWAAHGDERCAPGLIECLDDGFVQGVIVCHSNELPPNERAAAGGELSKLIAACSPHAATIRAPRSARSAGSELGALLSEEIPPFASEEMKSARAASSPEWAAAIEGGTLPAALPPNPALDGITLLELPPPPPLSVTMLQDKVAALTKPPTSLTDHGEAEPPQLLLFTGIVYGLPEGTAAEKDDDDVVDLNEGEDTSGPKRTLCDFSSGAMRRPYGQHVDISEAPESIVCVAKGLDKVGVGKALLACRPLPKRLPRITKSSIPADRMAALKLDLRDNAPLPDDVFYDGRMYISMDGDKSEDHPELESGVEKLLAELNATVDEANAVADEAARVAEVEGEAYLRSLAA